MKRYVKTGLITTPNHGRGKERPKEMNGIMRK